MRQLKFLFTMLAGVLLLLPSRQAAAQSVQVEVVSDDGWTFTAYPARGSREGNWRSYVEARRNARYGIRAVNNTGRRVGLVIAVDGRNIISGDRSTLSSSERMYVLDPYGTATYDGWRTGRNRINRFYFTNEGDSYAGAWDDYSAMGVIAVAAYAERRPPVRPRPPLYSHRDGGELRSAPAPHGDREVSAAAESDAGTGFGEEEYSSSVRVEFRPESYPLEKHFLKYEWKETLCRKNIISCDAPPVFREGNRFWPDAGGFVPPPPRRDREDESWEEEDGAPDDRGRRRR
ncbi:hypothetical protein [Candidatus Electronema sp. TJ]|uniref:hypothetical protein n=1 Tax=Candidatus Electronema sp. TJ TaxID=3401573 RepID=UPI003AA92D3A